VAAALDNDPLVAGNPVLITHRRHADDVGVGQSAQSGTGPVSAVEFNKTTFGRNQYLSAVTADVVHCESGRVGINPYDIVGRRFGIAQVVQHYKALAILCSLCIRQIAAHCDQRVEGLTFGQRMFTVTVGYPSVAVEIEHAMVGTQPDPLFDVHKD
jgi:hypothetical protein